jgi:acetyltransferase
MGQQLIRPIAAADAPLLRELVQSLSQETRYKRYFSPRTPTDEEILRWATADPAREYSLVAVDGEGGKLLGEARYVMVAPDEAEVAIVVGDRWQGRGLGRELMSRLIAAARRSRLRRLTGIALSTNRVVLSLAQRLGFRLARTQGSAWVTTLKLDLGA